MSDKLKEKVKVMHKTLLKTEKIIKKEEDKYNIYLSNNKNLRKYSKKLNLKNYFKTSKKTLSKLNQDILKIDNIVKNNKRKDELEVKNKLNLINISLKKIYKDLRIPIKRLNKLKNLITNHLKDKKNIENIFKLRVLDYKKYNEKSLRVIEKHKNKVVKLKIMKANIDKVFQLIKNNKDLFNKESEKNDINYLKLEIYLNMFNKENKKFKDLFINYNHKFEELDQSYSLILTDMNVKYYVIIARSSWDETSDSNIEHEKIYKPKLVSEKEFSFLMNYNDNLASYSPSFFSTKIKPKINMNLWNRFNIKETKKDFPSYDNSAVWYIKDTKIEYFHTYTEIKNSTSKTGIKRKVDEKTFYKNENNIGMEIISKPYGYFEDETIKDVSPPGINQVGNNHYGHWKTDSNGNSFWVYYGQYRLYSDLMGGSNYYRSDYNSYRTYRNSSNRNGYYGRNKEYGTFGSRTRNNKIYLNSLYMRTMKKNNYKRTTASRNIRSSGSRSRGRGPGGGGK